MPSTYTLNNGIELIGTGEQSGTWGDTTNTNLGLLDAALDGQVTITLGAAGSSGSPNALPITDGTTSNGRNRMVVFADGADLGATAYVQLTPNDAEKIIYIRNSLSGSRSVILFQGTYNASNDYEVPAGTTAVVYFDGAGAGAVAANVFNNAYFDGLRLGSVSVTAILDEDNMASDSATALATQQSIKAYVDAQVGTVDTLAEILAIGNTTGATDIAVDSAQKVQFRDAAIYINSSVDGQLDIVADTEIQIAATTIDVNGALDVSGTALVTGVLTTTAATVHTGGITMPDNAKAIFGTGSDLEIYHNGSASLISEQGTGSLIILASGLDINNAANTENMLTAYEDGAVTLYYDNALKLATTATGIDVTGTVTADGLTVDAGNVLFKGGDVSFYEDTGTTAKFFWDSSAESLGIGTSSPSSQLSLSEVTANTITRSDQVRIQAESSGTTGVGFGSNIYFVGERNGGTLQAMGRIGFGASTNTISNLSSDFIVETAAAGVATERMRITSAGNVGIGTTSPEGELVVYDAGTDTRMFIQHSGTGTTNGDGLLLGAIGSNFYLYGYDAYPLIFGTNNTERLRIDSSGNVGIGTSSPGAKLELSGGNAGLGILAATNRLRFTDSDPTLVSGQSTGAIEWYTSDTTSPGVHAYIGTLGANTGAADLTFGTGVGGSASEAMRIDSSGNLIVGKTSTSSTVDGVVAYNSGAIEVVRTSNPLLYLNLLTSDGDIAVFRKDGAPVGSIGNSTDFYIASQDGTGVRFSATQVLPCSESGATQNGSRDLGSSGARFQDLYLSGGVYLGGTGSANHLDDYEYGSFEPEFGGDVSDPTVTYDGTVGNEGWYVKAGRLVFIQINIRTDSVSGGSGAVVIRNLPFVTPNLSGQGGVGSFTIGYAENWGGERPIAGTISEGVTYINLSHRSAVDGDNITTNITDLGAGANANLIRLSGTYYTTA
jgi:phage baseplate assembly protein gpV